MNSLPVTDAAGRFLQVGQTVEHTVTRRRGRVTSFGHSFVRVQGQNGRTTTGMPTRVRVVGR